MACLGRGGSTPPPRIPPPPPMVLPSVSAQFVEISSLPQRTVLAATPPPIVSMPAPPQRTFVMATPPPVVSMPAPAPMPRMSGLFRVCSTMMPVRWFALMPVFLRVCARVCGSLPKKFHSTTHQYFLKVTRKWSNRQRIMEICPLRNVYAKRRVWRLGIGSPRQGVKTATSKATSMQGPGTYLHVHVQDQ